MQGFVQYNFSTQNHTLKVAFILTKKSKRDALNTIKMKKNKITRIEIQNLHTDILHVVLLKLDVRSLKRVARSSKHINNYVSHCLFFWQNFSQSELFSINECKQTVKRKYIMHKNIKIGKNDKFYSFFTNQKDITSMIISNNMIYISSDDASVQQFSFDGFLIKSFNGHKGGVWTIAIGKYFVTGSTDKTAIIWNLDGHMLHKLKGHVSTVRVVKIHGEYVVTGGRDSNIRVWNVLGKCLHILDLHTKSVRCLEMNKDFLLSGSYDGTVILWDYKKGKKIFYLPSHQSRVYGLILGNKYIVSAGQDSYIHISTYNNELICRYKEHKFIVLGLSFTHNERYLVSSWPDDTLCKYDVIENKKIYKIVESQAISSHFVFENVIFVTTMTELKIYDYNTGLFIRKIMEAEKFVKVEMNNNRLFVAYLQNNKCCIGMYDFTLPS